MRAFLGASLCSSCCYWLLVTGYLGWLVRETALASERFTRRVARRVQPRSTASNKSQETSTLLMSVVPNPAAAARRLVQLVDLDQVHRRNRQDQHLRNPHATLDGKCGAAEVDQRHHHLAAII